MHKNNLFNSWVWAGYECTFAKIETGERLNVLADTKHDRDINEDYKLIKEIGISTAREGLAWSLIDKEGKYNFDRFEEMMALGSEAGVEQVWDLNHFDYPDDLDPLREEFVYRYGKYAAEAVRLIRKYRKGTIYIVPMNEISFFSYIGGDIGRWAPYLRNQGGEFKKQLVRAALEAMKQIWKVDSDVRFVQVDPIVRRISKDKYDKKTKEAERGFKEAVYEAWDMLSGRIYPELGGGKEFLDIVGVNYYYYNQQWIVRDETREDGVDYPVMGWNSPFRISFAEMLAGVHRRYKRPIVITETGMWGDLRYRWWRRLFREIDEAREKRIPVLGMCVYPIIDRADWGSTKLTNSGLWDYIQGDVECRRIPHEKSIAIVADYARRKNDYDREMLEAGEMRSGGRVEGRERIRGWGEPVR